MLSMVKGCCYLVAALLVSICAGVDVTTTAATCEAMGEGSSTAPECAAAPGEVLLQRGRNTKKRQQRAAIVTEEDSAKTYKLRATKEPAAQLLSKNAAVQEISVTKTPDGKTATVIFEHRGTKFNHKLSAVSVYSEGATVKRHTSTGEVRVDARSLQSRRFRSYQPGRRASATLHEDGSVSGFFEDAGKVVRVDPAARHNASEIAGLLQEFRGRGTGHLVQFVAMPKIGSSLKASSKGARNDQALVVASDPELAIDEHPPIVASDEAEEQFKVEMMGRDWSGQAWSPGCYAGDSSPHVMGVKVIADNEFYKLWGGSTRDVMEEAVFSSSFIYEMQMNFRVEVSEVEIFESSSSSDPAYAFGCMDTGKGNLELEDKLFALRDEQAANPSAIVGGATHLFSNCGRNEGIGGIAYVGVACLEKDWSVGVDQLSHATHWTIFAHELGHNLNAAHTFEEGQGRTGGIMDYGDGTLNGEYQFNTQYRKEEVCGWLDRMATDAPACFAVDTTPPTPLPTPLPTPAPPCEDSESWRSWWGYPCKDFSAGWCWRWDLQRECKKLCNMC